MTKNRKVLLKTVALLILVSTVFCGLSRSGLAPVAGAADDVAVGAASPDAGTKVYSSTAEDKEELASLAKGDIVYVTAEVVSDDGVAWLAVKQFAKAPTYEGYVLASDLTRSTMTADAVDAVFFERYLDEQNFPESYRASLRSLHKLYPEWEFVAVHTGLQWSSVVSAESVVGKNLVPRSSNQLYINTSDVDSNGNQRGRDGSSWVAASSGIIAYYLDPRNFLSVPYIFQFESLSYSAVSHTESGINRVLANTFMAAPTYFEANGTTYTYAQTFLAAAQASGISPYYLASKIKQEQGVNGTALSSGTISGYEGYYNFFNINAYTTSSAPAMVNGAIYAKKQGWNNQYASIVSGSSFIGRAYIAIGQDTIYFQKFNVVYKPSLYSHQYMTNVMGAASEASILRNAYSDLDMPISFKIPVYLNMPASAVSKPTSAAAPSASSSAYALESGYVSRISPQTTVASLISALTVTNNGSARVVTSSGAVKNSGALVTGDKLQIMKSSGAVQTTYNVVIYGDANRDGEISLVDMLTIKKQVLKLSSLGGAQLKACDVNKDGSVTIIDMLVVKRSLLGLATISQ